MGDSAMKIDVERLISYGDDLIELFKNKKDINNLMQSLEGAKMLQSSCETDFSEVKNLLEAYQIKIDECERKIGATKSEVIGDANIDFLQKELEEELHKEHILREEHRILNDEISDLEHQRVSVEERKQILKKLKKDELRAQGELSMYASVTNIIPNLDDQNKTSGHVVDRDKRVVEKFEFTPGNASTLEICNSLWKMTSS